MTMTIPTIPNMPAGYVAQAADLNNLAYAAQFLLTRPIARISDTSGTQTIGTSAAAISFNTVTFDPDTMYNSGTPTRLTVQTPGFYKISYLVNAFSSGTSISMNAFATITTGTGNPAGSGVTTNCWAGGGAGGATGQRICARATGILPFYMYAGDFVTVSANAAATGNTLSVNSFNSFLALELVSI